MSPIFLVAARRSGTTLFRLMLNGHPEICWFRGWETVATNIEALSGHVSRTIEVPAEGLGTVTTRSIDELRENIDLAIQNHLISQEKRLFGATVHVGFTSLLKAWPNARFIHLVRDPRDIATSNMKLGWSGHHFESAHTWSTAERDWDLILPLLKKGQFLEISYESLVTDPEETLMTICDFLEVPFRTELFSYTANSNYGYPKSELANRWRGKLKKREIKLIEYGIHDMMIARGYEPKFSELELNQLQIFFFKQVGRWRIRRHSIEQLGFGHVALRKLSKIFRSRSLQNRIRAREEMKRKQHIENLESNY